MIINCHPRKQSLHSKKSSWLMWSFTLCITLNSKFLPSSLPGAVMVKSIHHLRPWKELMGGVWYGGRVLSGGILRLTCSISSHVHWYRTEVEDGFPCQLGAGTTATWQDLLWMVAYLQSEVSSHRPLTAGVTCRADHGCDEQCLAKQWETKSLKYEASKEMEVGIAKKRNEK